jgi:hypothetical protein
VVVLVGVLVFVGVGVLVAVLLGVGVLVAVLLGVGVAVPVLVGVGVGVPVLVGVTVGVGVGVNVALTGGNAPVLTKETLLLYNGAALYVPLISQIFFVSFGFKLT